MTLPKFNLPKNFVVLDTETSGLYPSKHAILSIGAVTASGAEFYVECSPRLCAEYEEKALEVNGFDWDECRRREISDAHAVVRFCAWLHGQSLDCRWVFGGKNPKFDYDFLCLTLARAKRSGGLELPISRRGLDLHSLAYVWALRKGIDFTQDGFSTDLIYRHLGFEPEPLPHDALTGARLEMAIFRKLLSEGVV